MFMMLKKIIGEEICHSIYWYAKANSKYIKYYDKNKEFSYLDANNLYGKQCRKSFQKKIMNGSKVFRNSMNILQNTKKVIYPSYLKK